MNDFADPPDAHAPVHNLFDLLVDIILFHGREMENQFSFAAS